MVSPELLAHLRTAADIVNGCFEGFGAYAAWGNVKRLKRDRDVKGIVWQYTAVWWVWGVWNIAYYPFLHQWFSAVAGVVLCIGNAVWVMTWLRISRDRAYAVRRCLGGECDADKVCLYGSYCPRKK